MLANAAHTVLATPELLLLVSAHLAPHDLAQCLRVCKDWSHQLEPILWADFCPKENKHESWNDASMRAALIRNLPLIRTAKIPVTKVFLLELLIHDSETDPSARCTNLTRLEFENSRVEIGISPFTHFSDDDVDLASDQLATLLELNDRLTHLKLPCEFIDTDAPLDALSNLDHLQHLTVVSPEDCEGNGAISNFLRACLPLPRLTELVFDLDQTWDKHTWSTRKLRTIIQKASKERFSRNPTATKIKSLRLPSNCYGKWNPLPLLLLKSNLLDLESCEIPCFDEATDPQELERVVREQCLNLKHLTCPSLSQQEQDGHHMAAFLRGCSGIQSFASKYFCDHAHGFEPRRIMSTLVSHHYKTLEVLELMQCRQMNSADQQEVLSRCRQLKRFWVMNSLGWCSSIGFKFEDIWSKDWACMELTKLGLTLDQFFIINPALGMREAEEKEFIANVARRVYTQIGRLQKLEVLALDIDTSKRSKAKPSDYAWDLTLSKGWLSEMAGLRRLKSLSQPEAFWSKMGHAEVEFIYEHWPSLKEINLQGHILQMSAQSPWLWLLSKRPQLQLVFKHAM
ncbi:hypothetical protein BGZ70_009109 [Mortierella alpina]|uniref:F-box domain-containing protein n=1 Tax=Mortierella alpina TaxID=64518 RepID=A0A9P6J2K2_MORAP|nr:hypothetical protein BGZ70_009109 [Mortierella alpina]